MLSHNHMFDCVDSAANVFYSGNKPVLTMVDSFVPSLSNCPMNSLLHVSGPLIMTLKMLANITV